MRFTRRQLLKSALASTAACGLANIGQARERLRWDVDPIIDTHVYLGHWPHRRLSSEQPGELIASLRGNEISQAWVGSFDGLFHKDIAAVNQRLAKACSQAENKMLIPFGTVNPMLPDWEEDIRRCHETFHMPGIRLHPNYHGYTLGNERFARLLELAAARNLIVQLVAWMEDERHPFLNPQTSQVELKPLAEQASRHRNLRLVVANGYRMSIDDAVHSLAHVTQVHFDFALANTPPDILQLGDIVGVDRVVFGSCEPLHRFEAAWGKTKDSNLSGHDKDMFGSWNADRLITGRVRR